MVYKLKSKKKNLPSGYWKERELKDIKKKYKGKLPPFKVVTTEGTRIATQVPKRIHKKGEWVLYKEKLARVEKSTPRGTYIRRFRTKEGFAIPDEKLTYIPEKEYRKKVYPAFITAPLFSWRVPITIA